MARYAIRIVDARTGKQLGEAKDLPSPAEAGRVAVDAYTVLVLRDKHNPAHLELHGVLQDLGISARPARGP